jgi:hypothetical protein
MPFAQDFFKEDIVSVNLAHLSLSRRVEIEPDLAL